MNQFNAITIYSQFLCKKASYQALHRGWRSNEKLINKQYLEIEIARRRNGRVDRPGLDDDNATSLKRGNEEFLDYMLDSVFVGSK